MNKCKVGFIGYGNMAKAIAASFENNDIVECAYAYDVNPAAQDKHVIMLGSSTEVIAKSDYVFLSIKPQMAKEALAGCEFTDKIVISIMAGKKSDELKELCTGSSKIVRVMPNLCARVRKAVNAYCAYGLSEEELKCVHKLLSSFGLASYIGENYFDAITGLTGSSPAYIFRFAKDIIECGVQQGIEFEQAKELVLYCISGCMDLMKSANSVEEMQTMIDNVCSKGGTTIEGIYKLNEGDFDKTVKSAINAAIKRSEELSKK